MSVEALLHFNRLETCLSENSAGFAICLHLLTMNSLAYNLFLFISRSHDSPTVLHCLVKYAIKIDLSQIKANHYVFNV